MPEFLPYRRELADGLVLVNSRPEHAEQLEQLQMTVFPDLSDAERFKARHYRKHIELFPEGQFVVLDGDRVVGMTTAIRMKFDFAHAHEHRFEEVIQGGYLTSHEPDGDWLYGADIGTHPDYRKRGLARSLYQTRHECVRYFGLKGQVTVGMLNGYGKHSASMSIDEYYALLAAGKLQDPTVSTQMRVGFELRGLVKNYLSDPTCGDAGALIVLPAEKDVQ